MSSNKSEFVKSFGIARSAKTCSVNPRETEAEYRARIGEAVIVEVIKTHRPCKVRRTFTAEG